MFSLIDDDTFFRIYCGRQTGMPIPLEEISMLASIGERVFVAHDGGTAIFVRASALTVPLICLPL